jgi:hypothetical protein
LQLERSERHAIVVADLTLLLHAQDLVEAHSRERSEGRTGLGRLERPRACGE